MNSDLKYLIASYLNLEEVLTIYGNNLVDRNEIIRLCYKELPNIREATINGSLETIKYLYEMGITSEHRLIKSLNLFLNLYNSGQTDRILFAVESFLFLIKLTLSTIQFIMLV